MDYSNCQALTRELWTCLEQSGEIPTQAKLPKTGSLREAFDYNSLRSEAPVATTDDLPVKYSDLIKPSYIQSGKRWANALYETPTTQKIDLSFVSEGTVFR